MKHHSRHHHRTKDDRHAQGADGFVFTDALEQAGINPATVDEAVQPRTEQAA
jgi:hypothetical protein